MGFLDDAKNKLSQAVGEHGDKIKQGIEKAGDAIDQRTGGKYADKIEKGKDAASRALDKVEAQGDGAGGSTEGAAPLSDGHYEATASTDAPPPPAPDPEPDGPAPGTDPGGVDAPGNPTDPQRPTG